MTDLYSELALERKSLPPLVGTEMGFFWLVLLIVVVGICVLFRKFSQRATLTDTPANDTRGQ